MAKREIRKIDINLALHARAKKAADKLGQKLYFWAETAIERELSRNPLAEKQARSK